MKAVRTADSNMVYTGPTPDISDLHCQREALGRIRSIWWFTPAEREAIAAGANLSLRIMGEPIPPVSLEIVLDQGIGEDKPDVLARLAEYSA